MSIKNYSEELSQLITLKNTESDHDEMPAIITVTHLLVEKINQLSECVEAVTGGEGAENLHNLRIILRKMRSLVDGEPEIFSTLDRESFIKALSTASVYTGGARDTDTLIFAIDSYFEELPACFSDGKKGVTAAIRKRGVNKRRALRNFLKGKDFENAIKEICHIIKSYNTGTQEDAALEYLPINIFAKRRIYCRLSKILRFIDKNKNIDESQIHKLRIQCKKLRYDIELLGGFTDIKKIKKLIGTLKELQNTLGFYNDLCVHQEILQELAEGLEDKSIGAVASVMTIILALKAELTEEIEDLYKSMRKKDKLFNIKKSSIRKYIDETKDEEEEYLD